MQQQQALASERQESISNTLGQVTSMLQDISKSPQPYNVNQNHTVTDPRGTRLPTINGRQQVQSFSAYPDGHENRGYRATECHRLQDNRLSQLQENTFQESQVSQIDYNVPQDGWTEDSTLSNATRGRNYQSSWHVNQPARMYLSDAKLPPFNGKEDWKVWIARFEAIAKRRNWNDETKLDNLLPRLQGRAGDFVFNQLSYETISSYSELVKELKSRFRVVETQKTFAAKFSMRVQKQDETVEEYAAELKRLYSKAYKSRDSKTRQEDLVRRFLDGLKDNEARFEIEFHKEPEDIDEAVYHAVNFIQTRRRNSSGNYYDKKFKKYARRTSQESDTEDSEIECKEEGDDYEYALRLPTTGDTYQKKRHQKGEQKTEQNSNRTETQPDSIAEIKDMVKALVEELQNGRRPAVNQQQ
ncbi:MAG: hypothetical protein ABW092_10890, partial [Candidatus Thiodiazotropha sp.]